MNKLKVLILAYDFPPYVSVGGLRPYSWYKDLSKFDVYPIVVTRQWENKHGNHLDYVDWSKSNSSVMSESTNGTLISTSYKPNLSNRLLLKFGEERFRMVRKSISAFYEFFQFYLPLGMKFSLYKAANKYMSENKVDIIIATGDPFILFKYANKLSSKYNVPWIADYRDLWSQDVAIQNKSIIRKWMYKVERKIISKATSITTVSDILKRKVNEIVPLKKIDIIHNGYDQDNANKIASSVQGNNMLSLGFVGSIYPWHAIKKVLSIVFEMNQNEKSSIHLNFYGVSNEGYLRKMIETNYPFLKNEVTFYQRMKNDKLLLNMSTNNMLLLFNDYSFLGTKIFDYLALKRKILLCFSGDQEALKLKEIHYHTEDLGNENLQAELIDYTNSGVFVKDGDHLKLLLMEAQVELNNNGFVACNSINIKEFCRERQVEKLAKILKNTKY